MDYVIDLMPFLIGTYGFLKPTLYLIIMALAAWATKKIADHFHIKSEVLSNDRLQEIMGRGLAFALSRLHTILSNRKLEIHTKNQIIATAASYVAVAAPGTLKKFGITPERLAELVEAKLADAFPAIYHKMPHDVFSEQATEPETREVP